MDIKKKKAIVAMSGGVDSSVVAWLLKQEGYDLVGIFMRLGAALERESRAEEAARNVCQALGIKFYPFNLGPEFRQEVIDYFIKSYAQGFTPNPCVKCNKIIKFGRLLRLADELGAEHLATGHYIIRQLADQKSIPRTRDKMQNIFKLFKGKDREKDQSYFLYNLTQEQLQRIIFPLGEMKKKEVKKIAEENNLPVLREESQDICFLSGDHNDFLKNKIKLTPGLIKDLSGKTIGEHQGLPLYTIGQRRGVEIGGTGPYYVVKADYQHNTLYVSNDRDDPALYSRKIKLSAVNWVVGRAPKFPLKCQAVIRYRHEPVDCVVDLESDGAVAVEFSHPQRAVALGQSAVFYKKNEVLGGGEIVGNE